MKTCFRLFITSLILTTGSIAQTWVPLYRLAAVIGGCQNHLYTTNPSERPSGYTFEGIECFVSSTSYSGASVWYRLRNNSTCLLRLYTTSSTERSNAISSGYVSESDQGYLHLSGLSGQVYIYRAFKSSIGDRFYTTDWDELQAAISSDYIREDLSSSVEGFANLLNVTAPNSSSNLSGGTPYSITWYSRTAPHPAGVTLYDNVRIDLLKGGSVYQNIVSSTSNAGGAEAPRNYSWTPSTGLPTGSDYAIKVSYVGTGTPFFTTPQFTITNNGGGAISVSIGTNPSGLYFTVDGTPYFSAQPPFAWTAGTSHSIGTADPLAGPGYPASRYHWLNWNDNGVINNNIQHTISPTTNSTYTANFVLQYLLTMNAGTGGTVAPSTGNYYDTGTPVTITATPNSGYVFNGWVGSGTGSYTGLSNPVQITMNGPITESASFVQHVAPIVVTTAATDVATNEAQLNGTINSNGPFNTYYYFEWGTSQSYGNNTGPTGPNYYAQTTAVHYSMLGLSPDMTYHYRLVAWNGADTSRGGDLTFTTNSLTRSITVTYPSAADIVMQRGITDTIRWSSTNYSGDVQVWLYKGGGPKLQISGNHPNTGKIDFTPGCDIEDGLDYRILVAAASTANPHDLSDNDFQITSSSSLSKEVADVCVGIVRLKFPLRGTSSSNPNSNDGPFTHDIISFFDHKRRDNSLDADGMVINFVGDTSLSTEPRCGSITDGLYKARDGRRFDAKVPNYQNPPADGYCGKDNVFYMFYDGHNGYDYKADDGTPVYPAFTGIAEWVGGECGLMKLSNSNGYVVNYYHCSQKVYEGTVTDLNLPIALSGHACAPKHLHFELRHNGVVVDPYQWLGSDPDPWHANTDFGNKDLWEQRDIPYYVRATVVGSHLRIQWIYDGERTFLDHFKVFRQNNEEQPNIREVSVAPNPLGYYHSYDDYTDLVMGRTYRYYVQPFSSSGSLAHASAGVEIVFNPSDHATQTMFAFSNSVAPLSVPTGGVYQVALNYGASSMQKFRGGTHSSIFGITSADPVHWEMIDSSGEHFDNTSFNVSNYSSNEMSQSFVISLDSSQSGILNLLLAGTDNITLGDSVVISSQITPFNGAIFKVLSEQVDFDHTPIGSTVKDSFAIYNIGNQPLQVTWHYVGSSSFNMASGSTTVSPSSSSWIGYSFTPTDTMESNGQVIITHNGATSPDTVSIAGRGTYTVTNGYQVLPRWNLVSVPLFIYDGAKADLFPSAISSAFAYEGSYVQKDTLKPGIGYWLKFTDSQSVFITGVPVSRETLEVSDGWNLIGSISDSLPVTSITSIPAGMKTSQLFGYDGHYFTTNVLVPSQGYWVKVAETGKLILASGSLTAGGNRIRIVANSELPPPPPHGAENDDFPKDFALQQNYPNPFNPSTSIKYQLPIDSKVSLTVFNVLGQTVAVLTDRIEQAGYKSVDWNVSNFASGVYFYRLDASSLTDPSNSFIQVKKMLLLR